MTVNWPKLLSELRFPLRRPVWLLLSFIYTGLLYVASLQAGLLDIGSSFWILTAGAALLLSPIYHGVLIPWMLTARLETSEGDSKAANGIGVPNGGRGTRVDVERTFARLVIGEFLVNALVVGGVLVFLVPGIYFGIRLIFYKQEIIAGDASPIVAMRESFRRTADWRFAAVVFAVLAGCYGIVTGIDLLLLMVAPPWLVHAGSITASALLLLYVNSFVTAFYGSRVRLSREDRT